MNKYTHLLVSIMEIGASLLSLKIRKATSSWCDVVAFPKRYHEKIIIYAFLEEDLGIGVRCDL